MRFFFLAVVLLALGGGALWWVTTQPWAPEVLQAKSATVHPFSLGNWQDEAQQIDTVVANSIRQAAAGNFSVGQDFLNSGIQQVRSATLSAHLETTPQELWQTLREEGARAMLADIAQQTAVSVNGVSSDVLTEGRYQYCVGVVQQYESQ